MATSQRPHGIQKSVDQSALLLMLGYIETECRALGAEEAARHVAQALFLLDSQAVDGEPAGLLNLAATGRA